MSKEDDKKDDKKDKDKGHGSQFWNRSVEARLDTLLSLIQSFVNNNEDRMNTMVSQLEVLTASVNSSVQVQQTVVSLLGRVVDFIVNNRSNPEALTNLANILNEAAASLAAARDSTESALTGPSA